MEVQTSNYTSFKMEHGVVLFEY